MNRLVLLLFLIFGCSRFAVADLEFFFITTPSVMPDAINRLVQTFPLAGVGHGAVYVSSACRDERSAKNLIRPCTERDEQQGLVVSFDVTLQEYTGFYFLAVTRDEFFYGIYEDDNLPAVITPAIVKETNDYFFKKFPFLKSEGIFQQQVEPLTAQTGLTYSQLREVIAELWSRGINENNLQLILREKNIDPGWGDVRDIVVRDILTAAEQLEKYGITADGISRVITTWSVRFYQGVWSIRYPTTPAEELAAIDYINSLYDADADILAVNCVMPLDKMSTHVLGAGEERPELAYVPYFVLRRLSKGAFETSVAERNTFGELIRRPDAYMRFYPQLKVEFAPGVNRAPVTPFNDANVLGFYRRYQGQYSNQIQLLIERLEAEGTANNAGRIDQLEKLHEYVLSEEKSLNLLIQDYERAQVRDPRRGDQLERMRSKLRQRVDRELEAIVGTGLVTSSQGNAAP